jgi:phage/plasmid primase-like uncharacterized protein
MLTLMRDARTDEPRAVHRTALDGDGAGHKGKAALPDGSSPKKMLGSSSGCVVKLTPDEEVTYGLGICEGIETGLSLVVRFGWQPIWATCTTGLMRTFPVLSGINSLTIFADNDESGSGQEAAADCAARYVGAGFTDVQVVEPQELGEDWNDAVQRLAP